MNPTMQARRSLWHVAARWQSRPPPRLLTRSFASTLAVSTSDAAEDVDAEQQQQLGKTTTSSKGFNLMSVRSVSDRQTALADISGPAAWKRATSKKDKHRRKTCRSKWWADMDRVSFHMLLTEEMGSNKVSSVLRKVRTAAMREIEPTIERLLTVVVVMLSD